jgi:hypothetical protein
MSEYLMETSDFLFKRKFRSQPVVGRVMSTLFCCLQGPILEHYQKKGVKISSVCHSQMLHDKLKLEIQHKPQGQLPKCVALLDDSVCPHTVEILQK